MKRILVTGAGGSASFNFVRSLRQNPNNEKLFIVGTDTSKYHIELNDLDRRYIVPPCEDSRYLDILNQIIDAEKIDFVHPQPDQEVQFLAVNHGKLHAKTLLPDAKTVLTCQDKMILTSKLRKKNVPVPLAFPIQEEADFERALGEILKKTDRAWLRAIRGAGSRAALPIKTATQGKMWVQYWQCMKNIGYGDFMLSEYLPGKEYAFQSLWLDGELLASQARERIEYIFGHLLPSGQSSSPSVAKTVSNSAVNRIGHDSVLAIDPRATGVFCIDMKTDAAGEVCLIEINAGRFFTTSFFFSHAGLNMPYSYLQLAFGEKPLTMNKFNNLKPDLFWVRMIDMGYKLIADDEWRSVDLTKFHD